jgi:hypothetical protein
VKIEIILSDDEGQPLLEVHNCHQSGLVYLKLIHAGNDNNVVVNINDLRAALRKINA